MDTLVKELESDLERHELRPGVSVYSIIISRSVLSNLTFLALG